MIYKFFANCAKRVAHSTIDHTFPRNPTIAAIVAGVAWYSYRYGMTYSQGQLAKLIQEQFEKAAIEMVGSMSSFISPDWAAKAGRKAGEYFAPIVVPWLSPYLSSQWSIGCALGTSFALNMLARLIFGPMIKKDAQNPVPEVLKQIGIDIKPLEEAVAKEAATKTPPVVVPLPEQQLQKSEKGTAPSLDPTPVVPLSPAIMEFQPPYLTAQNGQFDARKIADLLPEVKPPLVFPKPRRPPSPGSKEYAMGKSARGQIQGGQKLLEKTDTESPEKEGSEGLFDDDPLMRSSGWCRFFC